MTDTELRICGTGTGRRSDDCRAAVHRELAAIKQTFIHCMRAYQPVPVARSLADGGFPPPFARPFDPGNDLVSGWVLPLCHPALPEHPTKAAVTAELQ